MNIDALALVVDVGQTSTRATLAGPTGAAIDVVTDGPGEHLAGAGAAERAADRIERCWRRLDAVRVGDVIVSATGFERVSAEALAMDLLTRLAVRRVVVVDDAAAEYAATVGERAGVLLILGTGCVVLAGDGHGRWSRQGGTGWAIGDEPGGFAIGRMALGDAVARLQGREGSAVLADAAVRRFKDPATWGRRVYGSAHPVATVASFAEDVLAAAAAGDPGARRIWDGAAGTIVRLVLAGANGVDLPAPRRTTIVGGLARMPRDLQDSFVRRLEREAGVTVEVVASDPAARLGALRGLGGPRTRALDTGVWVEAIA